MPAALSFAGCADVADMLERLPFELSEAVYAHVGLATKLLHGRLRLPVDNRTKSLLWIDCMANNVVSCVPLLPRRNLTFEKFLAPPSADIKAAIRARRDMAPVGLKHKGSVDFVMRSALFSPETCRMLLQRELRSREGQDPVLLQKQPYSSDWAVMVAAAGLGDTATMQSIISSRGTSLDMDVDNVAKAALRYDQASSLEILLPYVNNPKKLVSAAIDAKAVECFKMLLVKANVANITNKVISRAVMDNKSFVLQAIVVNQRRFSFAQMDCLVQASIEHRRFDLLQALSSSGFSLSDYDNVAAEAALRGDMELLGVIKPHLDDGDWFKIAMRKAAGSGDLDAVRRLHNEFDLACDHTAMDAAAAGGHLGVLGFLHTHRAEGYSAKAMNGAARGGHLDIVRFLHEQRIVCDDAEAMDGAASNGHLDVLEFLRTERGGRCSSRAIVGAARSDHGSTVDWLLEHFPHESMQGMPDAIKNAASSKHRRLATRLVHNHIECVHDDAVREFIEHRWFDLVRIVFDSDHFTPSIELARAARTRIRMGAPPPLTQQARAALDSENYDIAKIVLESPNFEPTGGLLEAARLNW